MISPCFQDKNKTSENDLQALASLTASLVYSLPPAAPMTSFFNFLIVPASFGLQCGITSSKKYSPPISASPPTPSFEHILPTCGKTHTHRFSLGARRALHAWQALIPFLTSLPRGANEADQSNVALEDKRGMCRENKEGCWEVFS